MNDEAWEPQVKEWIGKREAASTQMAEQFVQFFRLAFVNTHHPHQAWFGAHGNTLSLVVGGIFLAAVVSSGREKGIWLLVDHSAPRIDGLHYSPVQSTQQSATPLIWAHSEKLASVGDFLSESQLWWSYSQASEKILNSPVAHDRDKLQLARGKKRLDDFFWRTGKPRF